MAKRLSCEVCGRPMRNCICSLVQRVDHTLSIGILQHPLERTQAKGTAKLTQLCLSSCCLWVGEHLDQLPDLQAWLQQKPTYLLYPSSSAEVVLSTQSLASEFDLNQVQVLLLDGTWRKTRRLLEQNPPLLALPRLALNQVPQSRYSIRKATKDQSLSTLEAVYCVLSETAPQQDFGGLLQAFDRFLAQQQAFLPASQAEAKTQF